MNAAMRSVQVPKSGGPEVMRVIHWPSAECGEGQLRVEVAFAGVNFADIAARAGLYGPAPKPPLVLGFEVSGRVSEVGPGVTGFAVGDQVLAVMKFGGYVDEAIVEAARARKLPKG